MPIVFNSRPLEDSSLMDNLFCISGFVHETVIPELKINQQKEVRIAVIPAENSEKTNENKEESKNAHKTDEEKNESNQDNSHLAKITASIVETFLQKFANSQNLSFENALEVAPVFGKVLIEFFKEIIKKGQLDKLASSELFDMNIFGPKKEEIIFWLQRFRRNDDEIEKRARSLVDILNQKGYLQASETFFSSDLDVALEGYLGNHETAIVQTDISLYVDDPPDLKRLEVLIKNEKKSVDEKKQERSILIPTNNGTYHFVYLDITIKPSMAIAINLIDSKSEEKVSEQHQFNNAIIISNIRKIDEKAEIEIKYSGEDTSEDSIDRVTYTGEQGEDANCPFYSVREIVRKCSRLPNFKIEENNDLSAAAEQKDIVPMQLAMVKKVAKKARIALWFDADKLEIDELGILHTIPLTAEYLVHKRAREAISKQSVLASQQHDQITQGEAIEETQASSLLHEAAMHNNVEYFHERSLTPGESLNRDEHGNTPLLWAIANSSIAFALQLLELAPDDNKQVNLLSTSPFHKNTPLILSVSKGSEHKGKDQKNDSSATPKQKDVVEKLLEKGAQVDAADASGRTALHYACLHRDIETIKKLLVHGATPTIKDNQRCTPSALLFVDDETRLKMLRVATGGSTALQTFTYAPEPIDVSLCLKLGLSISTQGIEQLQNLNKSIDQICAPLYNHAKELYNKKYVPSGLIRWEDFEASIMRKEATLDSRLVSSNTSQNQEDLKVQKLLQLILQLKNIGLKAVDPASKGQLFENFKRIIDKGLNDPQLKAERNFIIKIGIAIANILACFLVGIPWCVNYCFRNQFFFSYQTKTEKLLIEAKNRFEEQEKAGGFTATDVDSLTSQVRSHVP